MREYEVRLIEVALLPEYLMHAILPQGVTSFEVDEDCVKVLPEWFVDGGHDVRVLEHAREHVYVSMTQVPREDEVARQIPCKHRGKGTIMLSECGATDEVQVRKEDADRLGLSYDRTRSMITRTFPRVPSQGAWKFVIKPARIEHEASRANEVTVVGRAGASIDAFLKYAPPEYAQGQAMGMAQLVVRSFVCVHINH